MANLLGKTETKNLSKAETKNLENKEIDLVILDVMMGAVNGYSVAQKIRQTPEISKR